MGVPFHVVVSISSSTNDPERILILFVLLLILFVQARTFRIGEEEEEAIELMSLCSVQVMIEGFKPRRKLDCRNPFTPRWRSSWSAFPSCVSRYRVSRHTAYRNETRTELQ